MYKNREIEVIKLFLFFIGIYVFLIYVYVYITKQLRKYIMGLTAVLL
jgi:hypothetical protein